MSKHTPGPWRWVDLKHHGCTILDPNNEIVAMDIYACATVDLDLIAAAPDMLEVLQELDECAYYWSQYDVPVGIHDRIKLAIAKAKGEKL